MKKFIALPHTTYKISSWKSGVNETIVKTVVRKYEIEVYAISWVIQVTSHLPSSPTVPVLSRRRRLGKLTPGLPKVMTPVTLAGAKTPTARCLLQLQLSLVC